MNTGYRFIDVCHGCQGRYGRTSVDVWERRVDSCGCLAVSRSVGELLRDWALSSSWCPEIVAFDDLDDGVTCCVGCCAEDNGMPVRMNDYTTGDLCGEPERWVCARCGVHVLVVVRGRLGGDVVGWQYADIDQAARYMLCMLCVASGFVDDAVAGDFGVVVRRDLEGVDEDVKTCACCRDLLTY